MFLNCTQLKDVIVNALGKASGRDNDEVLSQTGSLQEKCKTD